MSTQFRRCPVFWFKHSFPAENRIMDNQKADFAIIQSNFDGFQPLLQPEDM
jgi:hypothetical protein